MFCNHCGAQIPETSKFCPKCGSTVAEAVQMQAGRAQQERKAADAHPDSQTPQDPERYQQLLALKARQDTERALQEAEAAQRQAEQARRKAAEAQKKYAEQYGGPQPAQGQQAPAQSTQAARAVPAEAAGASVPGDARPIVAEKKKKRLLPLILGLAALVSCLQCRNGCGYRTDALYHAIIGFPYRIQDLLIGYFRCTGYIAL